MGKLFKSRQYPIVRWHDIRHDTASTLARDGRTLNEIAEILGHKRLASTNRYTHLSTAHKSQVLNDTMPNLHGRTTTDY
jgi:site-specific recombinase XerD